MQFHVISCNNMNFPFLPQFVPCRNCLDSFQWIKLVSVRSKTFSSMHKNGIGFNSALIRHSMSYIFCQNGFDSDSGTISSTIWECLNRLLSGSNFISESGWLLLVISIILMKFPSQTSITFNSYVSLCSFDCFVPPVEWCCKQRMKHIHSNERKYLG